jgi:MSHA biogenesis protein MshJ
MKQLWLTQMARLDGLSLRERIFLFLSVLVVCGALVDTLWLSPAQTAYKQLLVRIDKQGGELMRLREVLKLSASSPGAGQNTRDELGQIVKQTADINQAVRQLLPGAEKLAPLAQALVHLLRRHDGLTLVRTTALAPEIAGPGNGNAAGSLPAGLTRQGVAFTVAGSYADLTRYVMSLETAMPQVRWGTLNLRVDKGQPELTLQLFLLGEAAP